MMNNGEQIMKPMSDDIISKARLRLRCSLPMASILVDMSISSCVSLVCIV